VLRALNLDVTPPITLFLDTSVDKVISPFIETHGIWEPTETAVIERVIRKGDTVLDVGANIGYYAVLFSRLVGDEGKVIAFEPDLQNFAILERNLRINHCTNVTAHRVAVADRAGERQLFLSPDNKGDHRLFKTNGRARSTVPTVALDDLESLQCPIHYVKIDTQGSEPGILSGMRRIVDENARHLVSIMEFCPGLLNASGVGYQAMLDLWDALDAHVFMMERDDQGAFHFTPMSEQMLHEDAALLLSLPKEDYARDVLVFFSEEAQSTFMSAFHCPCPE
jgi:FkbM family methyltransferase